MEQNELRALEYRCIQEEPPQCVAACPLHVDARAFCQAAAAGDWPGAWKVLRRTMPLPGVLARLCPAPCEAACKRSEAGEEIRVGLLERAAAARPAPPDRTPPLPRKPTRVAVLGEGWSGLTAAWDLAKKGWQVTLFPAGDAAGSWLLARHPELTPEILEPELALLTRWGVEVRPGAPVGEAAFLEEILGEFAAVYLSLEALPPASWGLERQEDGRPAVTPRLMTTSREGVFAGGLAELGGESPVHLAAQGRWAAGSLDRWLQQASLSVGREREGPFTTRLFTPLEGVAPLAAVVPADPAQGYSEDEARREAARCLACECMHCVHVCPYMEKFGAYPKKYARAIYNNAAIVKGEHKANKLTNSCSLCGLCEEVCPHDFAMQDLCLAARQEMAAGGRMPPSAHEFALLDLAYSQSEAAALTRHQPGLQESAHLFFPGCQTTGSAPEQVAQAYALLRETLPGGVGLRLGCCGAPAHWAGREDLFQEALTGLRDLWEKLGRPQVIAACPSCLKIFREHLPEVPAASLWTLWAGSQPPPGAGAGAAANLAVCDPCATRHDAEAQEAVRRLLANLGVRARELSLGKSLTECCGFGGLMENANPEVAGLVISRRAELAPEDYLCYCTMCRDRLAGAGKRALHLLDLWFPPEGDAAARPRPTWTARQENRARLKQTLAQELWGETPPAPAPHRALKLVISPEMRARLEERRILDQDLQQVIAAAEAGEEGFRHPETGHYLAEKLIYRTFFWVEYTPGEEGFVVHNAYTHRMTVAVGGRS
ncbi:MAG: 4Fe-4S dicluster domain-containing protein [Deltaproteobacteria bacterium]|nr:4Fe-4S dicluster domain-containing protein [Deltaproteobacteria bacterium]